MAGSHLAGYGQVRFEKVEIQDEWQEYTPVGEDTENIVVTLLSDTLIRNPQTGAYVSSLQPILMEEAEAAFVETRIVGGFNRNGICPYPKLWRFRLAVCLFMGIILPCLRYYKPLREPVWESAVQKGLPHCRQLA